MIWRIDHGELDGINPKVIVVLAGTNNVGGTPGGDAKVDDITRGLRALVQRCRDKAPNATILLTAIFPRNDNMAIVPEIVAINRNLAAMADGKATRFLNVNAGLADKDGVLFDGMMNANDKLHPTLKGIRCGPTG
jgi:lysophospholipase L1-like esterase